MSENYAQRNEEGAHRILPDDPAAIALLKRDHHRFRALFDRAKTAEGDALVPVAQEICMRLEVHMTVEEELLYPVLKPLDADEVDEGVVEHDAGKTLIVEIENLDGTEELYKAKVHVLGEQTIHHIDEEDEELFAAAKEAHAKGRIDLDALGREMASRQAELYAALEATGDEGETHEANAEEIPSA